MGPEGKLPGKGFDQARGIHFRVVHRRSDRAFIIRSPREGSFVQEGISPQRNRANSRACPSAGIRTAATSWDGAML